MEAGRIRGLEILSIDFSVGGEVSEFSIDSSAALYLEDSPFISNIPQQLSRWLASIHDAGLS